MASHLNPTAKASERQQLVVVLDQEYSEFDEMLRRESFIHDGRPPHCMKDKWDRPDGPAIYIRAFVAGKCVASSRVTAPTAQLGCWLKYATNGKFGGAADGVAFSRLVVAEPWRGKRIGSLLNLQAQIWAREQGYKTVSSIVKADLVGQCEAFRRLGFQEVKMVDSFDVPGQCVHCQAFTCCLDQTEQLAQTVQQEHFERGLKWRR